VFNKSKLPILKEFYLYSLDKIYILNILLIPLSVLYFIANIIKKYFFSNKKENIIPVVVIGNLTVGGTGKTSLVIWLCNYLSSKDYKIGIISGGYKTINPNSIQIVDDNSNVNHVGDEAILIYKNTSSIICKCKNRKKAYEYLVDNYNLDIIISDDGLNHYKLNRNINIVTIKENNPYGNGLILPAGPLRVLPSSIKYYDNIVVNKEKESSKKGFYYDMSKIISVSDLSKSNINSLSGNTVHLVTAIANPDFLIEYLNRLNINLKIHIYPDHFLFRKKDFNFNDNYKIIMTEKDFVKCASFDLKNTYYLPSKIIVDNDIKIMLNNKIENLLR
jgi:tetraacyldisaccharide 4'-kinase